MTDHLARAKVFIAIAESDDSKAEAYDAAAEEIVAAMGQDSTLSFREIDRQVGKGSRNGNWSRELVQWHTTARPERTATPYGGSEERERKDKSATRAVLREGDDATVKEIMASLPAEAVERMVEKGTDRLVENARAKRAEHGTDRTVRDLADDRFDPAEYWADTLIIRLNRSARELTELLERAGGLLLGSMEKDEAFEYLQDTERRVAEVRAAAQEQIRDGLEV